MLFRITIPRQNSTGLACSPVHFRFHILSISPWFPLPRYCDDIRPNTRTHRNWHEPLRGDSWFNMLYTYPRFDLHRFSDDWRPNTTITLTGTHLATYVSCICLFIIYPIIYHYKTLSLTGTGTGHTPWFLATHTLYLRQGLLYPNFIAK